MNEGIINFLLAPLLWISAIAVLFTVFLVRCWLQNLAVKKFHQLTTAVSQCLEQIKSVLNTNAGYLRLSSWRKARNLAQETLNRIDREPAIRLDFSTETNFVQLEQIAQWNITKLHRLAIAPSQCIEEIKSIWNTEAGYLRLSSWKKAKDMAQKTLEQIHRKPVMRRYLDFRTNNDFVQLEQIAQWSSQDIEKIHQLVTTVSQCIEEIQRVLNANSGYVRLSSWKKVKTLARETLARIESMGNYHDHITDANLKRLKEIKQWSDQDIKRFHLVSQGLTEIKTIRNAGYLRTSRWKRIKNLAQETLNQSKPLEKFLERIHHADFVLLKRIAELRQIAQWRKQDVEKIRKQYVTRCKRKFSAYFDQVGDNPLTDKQRDACVIDEDNNLVLAGAGTGKTTTMIGRAGFLIESGQAKPDQILMLAFANKAAEEMQERLLKFARAEGMQELLDEDRVKEIACTFHKLGKDIIAKVEEEQPSVSSLSKDDALLTKLKKQVDQWIKKEMRDNPSYKRLVLHYFSDYLYPAANPFDFETKGEYLEYIRANQIRTLKGEDVKGLGECLIANHLFALGIEYQYEADFKHKTRGSDFRQYKPDFYLPKYDIWIEHWGIDGDENTAPFVDRERYLRGMEWKRDLHKKHGTQLIETYHYELVKKRLQQSLEKKLKNLGVKFKRRSDEEMLEELRKFGAVSRLAELLADLLRACKRDGLSPDQLQPKRFKRFPSVDPDQLRQIREIFSPIYELYQNHLKEKQEIDFGDMVHKAIKYVKSGRFISRWRYILVDEFQDISEPRACLIKALIESAKKSGKECSLFCVGDDWQSIYRFTGSDIRFTTKFEAKFGPSKITKLEETFRFNDSICDISSRFVMQNSHQIEKTLKPQVTVNRPAVSLLRQKRPDKKDFDKGIDKRIDRVLEKINQLAKNDSQFQANGKKKKVYLLGRFRFKLPNNKLSNKDWMTRRNKQLSVLDIEAFTIHKSKGLEADYVVVLGLEGGKHGFPSKKTSHPLLEAMLPKLDDFPYAEERHLFYVLP